MDRKEKAVEYFKSGYNCAQAIVLAFNDLYPIDKNVIAKLSSSFGGGMGKLREVCGAVSGMFMVAGLIYGYETPETGGPIKTQHYQRIQELAGRFKEQNGSIICKELLGPEGTDNSPKPADRTPEYYKKRPCSELVSIAAGILEQYIAENPIE